MSKGFDDAAKLLVRHGANLDLVDCNGFTPLHEAALDVIHVYN